MWGRGEGAADHEPADHQGGEDDEEGKKSRKPAPHQRATRYIVIDGLTVKPPALTCAEMVSFTPVPINFA